MQTIKNMFKVNLTCKINFKLLGDDASPEGSPRAPPRRQERSSRGKSPGNGTANLMTGPGTQNRPVSNGLPPTPKVHMGACFSKVKMSSLHHSCRSYRNP